MIGPLTIYVLHGRILSIAEELRVPQTVIAKMSGNILFDLLMTLIPLLGIFFSYLNQCSTRNAAMVFNYLSKQAGRAQERGVRQVNEGYIRAADWDNVNQSQGQQYSDPRSYIQLQEQQSFIRPSERLLNEPAKPNILAHPLKQKKQKPGQISEQVAGVMRLE